MGRAKVLPDSGRARRGAQSVGHERDGALAAELARDLAGAAGADTDADGDGLDVGAGPGAAIGGPRPRTGSGAAPTPERTPDSEAALEVARRVVDLAADKLASDVLLLDIRGVSPIADYFVVCSAGSERQTAAILKDLEERLLEEHGRKALHTEGRADSGWVLLDYGDVIVHIFSPQQRAYYRLEELWSAATTVVRLQ